MGGLKSKFGAVEASSSTGGPASQSPYGDLPERWEPF
jgi:hypothetical protein